MKRLARTILLTFAVVSMTAASAALAAKQLRGSQITTALKKDLNRRVEKTEAWRGGLAGGHYLEGKPGDKMRPFRASSTRSIPAAAPAGAQGGRSIGWIVAGRISTTTGRTYIKTRQQP